MTTIERRGNGRNPLYAAADPRPGGRFPTGRYAPKGPCPWGPSAIVASLSPDVGGRRAIRLFERRGRLVA